MEELKMKSKKLCELKDQLVDIAAMEMAKGCLNVNTHEMGAVIDMIKDLAEAEEKCWKACYYKKIVEAMEEEAEENERMGYDNWRYSSGRYAPKGRGHRSGYRPGEYIDPSMMAEGFGENPWKRSSKGTDMTQHDYMDANDRMGYSPSPRGEHYERYRNARMGYHETKDSAHKEHMDATAREYVVDMAEAVKEMWRDADPNMRKEIKNKFVALTSELN